MTSFPFPTFVVWPLAVAAGTALLVACGDGEGEKPSTVPSTAALSLPAQLGQKLFFDVSLSASGRMSCASCHDPQHAYGPPNALAVQTGGQNLDKPGLRAVPSLRYKLATPTYNSEMFDPEDGEAPGPGGGFNWDGRANTLAQQAAQPLLSNFEMGNASKAAVVTKLRNVSYLPLFLMAFGSEALNDDEQAFAHLTQALEAFQKEDPDFRPYTSKFDAYVMRGQGQLSVAEQRGKAVFYDPNRGNCAACHTPDLNPFTDYMYAAIGVPRNAGIPANANARFADLGLCGPLRTDQQVGKGGDASALCGMFKTPTLRNVATRSVFFHNGAMTSLEQAIRFYNTRDTHPEIWYPTVGGMPMASPAPEFPGYGLVTTQYAGGQVQKFNDVPAAYRENIDPQMPLDGRAAGSQPPMSEQDIGDLLCFLHTLNDGFVPTTDSATMSGSCVR